MKLANLLLERRITLDLKATTKDGAIEELLGLISREGIEIDYARVAASIRERESIEDTSYGYGWAFPHARTDAVGEMFCLIGVSRAGLTEICKDGRRLHVVCLLLTPSMIAKLYLQTLSGLARFARRDGTLDDIFACETPADLIKLVANAGITIDKELLVKDIMRHDVATIGLDDSLREVGRRMFRHRLSALAVVEEGKLLGIINDRDIIKAALPDYRSLIDNLNYSIEIEPFEELLKQQDIVKVSQLYEQEFEVTTPETRIVEVAAMMIFKDVRRVFVVENDKLVGILLRKDIVNMVLR